MIQTEKAIELACLFGNGTYIVFGEHKTQNGSTQCPEQKSTEDDLIAILRTVKRSPKPVLIHCKHGSDRTGAAVAACRVVFDGWSVEEAVSELMEPEYGHHRTLYNNIPALLRSADWDRIKREVKQDSAE